MSDAVPPPPALVLAHAEEKGCAQGDGQVCAELQALKTQCEHDFLLFASLSLRPFWQNCVQSLESWVPQPLLSFCPCPLSA